MSRYACPNCGASIELNDSQEQPEYTACPECWFSFSPPRRARYWDELVTSAKEVRSKAADMPREKSFVWTIVTLVLFGILAGGTFWYRWSAERPPHVPSAETARLVRDSASIELHASPFRHSNPLIRHIDSIWRIRPKDSVYSRFRYVQASHEPTTDAVVPLKRLGPPMVEYVWSVAFVDSNGNESGFSRSSEFRSPVTLVRIDLSEWFNMDVVADEGDDHNDTLGGPYGRTLLLVVARAAEIETEESAGRDAIQGLPADRTVGSHRLGDYAKPNAIQRDAEHTSSIEVDVPHGSYLGLRFLVASVYGEATVPVRFEYDDGSSEQHALPCPNWQSTGGSTEPPIVPLLTDMDCYHVSKVRDWDSNATAIHEVHLRTHVGKTLVRFVIDAPHAEYTDILGYCVKGICRLNVLAVTALRLADEDEWHNHASQ